MKRNPSVKQKMSSVHKRRLTPSPKWALASAMVLSVVFSLQTRYSSADVNPPLANPPSGNVYPTFTNLETKSDLIVGQNLKIGNSIKPKNGVNFTLDADKINFKKDFEAAGSGSVAGNLTAGNDLLVGSSIKPKMGTTLSIDAANSNFTGKIYAADAMQLAKGLILGGDILSTIDTIKFQITNLVAQNNFNVGGDFSVGFNSTLNGALSVGKNASINGNATVKKNLTVVGDADITSIKPAGGGGTLKIDGIVSGAQHISAKSIGSIILLDSPSGKATPVPAGKNATSVASCPTKSYQMLACSLRYFDDMGNPDLPTPDIYNGKAAIGTSYIDNSDPVAATCHAHVWNQYPTNISYRIQATCFNPAG